MRGPSTNFVRDSHKNTLLKSKRGVGFEDVVEQIHNHNIIDLVPHPNLDQYPNQRYLIVNIRDYPYVCPCVINGDQIILKTIFASRKYKHLIS